MFTAAADFIRGVVRLFPAWVWTALAGVVASIIVGAVAYQTGRHDEWVDQTARAVAAELAAKERDAVAKEAAAAERLADAAKTAKLTEELRNAVQALPDAVPSDRRRALACARLRSQGSDTARLPECR